MTRYANNKNKSLEPILEVVAQEWKPNCLLGGGSVFKPELRLWTTENMSELVKILDKDGDNLYTRSSADVPGGLERLVADASLKKLVAECVWVQLLCPYKTYKASTKRAEIQKIWRQSGDNLEQDDAHLTGELLGGVGGPLQAFARNRWRELQYFVKGCAEILTLPHAERDHLLRDPTECSRRLTAIPGGDRLLSRHMVLFLLFPEERERAFSNDHRRRIAKTFSPKYPNVNEMPQDELDKLLLATRKRLEKERSISALDWYDHREIYDEWMHGKVKGTNTSDNDESAMMPDSVAENVIYYGPPGTGKTRELNRIKEEKYTIEEEQTGEVDLVSLFESWKLRWWEVIALALGDFESQKKDPKWPREIYEHPYVVAQGKLRSDDFNFRAVVPGTLRRHRVGGLDRIQIFYGHSEDKDREENKGKWSLIQNWREEVPDLEKRLAQLQLGASQSANGNTIRRFEYVTFHQSYSYEDFVEGIRPEPGEDGETTIFRIKHGVFRRICAQARRDPGRCYAMFIDEINRGNISKIFGELITLLEPDKRAHYDKGGNYISGMELTLPYSGERFGVPVNLNVYGAMNTADQSLVRLDKALRRRFKFKELMPDVGVIREMDNRGIIKDENGGKIDLGQLLEAINRRIRFLSDREHMIGHSYFTKVKSFPHLQQVMRYEVLPLLQDYFYEDWSRIQRVLRDHDGTQSKSHQIVCDKQDKVKQIFGFPCPDYEAKKVYYEIAKEITPEAVRKIYEHNEP